MTDKKILFIINPIAGQGAGKLAHPQLVQLATENRLNFEVLNTEHPGHAIDLARQAAIDEIDIIAAVGGDGTSNEVLNGMMQAYGLGHKHSTLGIIAIGRGNDLAFGFGVPPGLEAGFQLVKNGNNRLVDVGFVRGGDYPNGRYFGNGVGIGFDAVVGFEALKLTYLHGFLNYAVAALRTIFLYFKAPLVQIDYDDKKIHQPALMVSVMNGKRMGGGFLMAPEARQDDGLLDLCVAGQLSRLGVLVMIPKFIKGTQAEQPKITTGQAKKVKVVALDGTLPVHADGETICKAGKELSIEILKQSLNILQG